MNRTFFYTISESEEKNTIRSFLTEKGFSRHVLIELRKSGDGVLLNGAPSYLNVPLKTGDHLEIRHREAEGSEQILPTYVPLDVVYEDEDLILINKQAGLPIHPSIRHHENTLANGLCHYFQGKGEPFTFRCINRLDLDTTGLVLVAKNAVSGCILSQQMLRREIHREYLAVVEGMTAPEGTINAPIGRASDSIIQRCIDFEKGERAVTHYQRMAWGGGHSLLRIWLDTGRTHQIRVHMSYVGHPLPGDYLYHPVYDKIKRQPLHSHKLTFRHPISGELMEFTAGLPDDFSVFFS